MANFDAMVPLIPKDTRVPVDFAREQMKINQIEKIHELNAVDEDEGATIKDDQKRESSQQHQHQQSSAQTDVEEVADNDETLSSGHIDTYA